MMMGNENFHVDVQLQVGPGLFGHVRELITLVVGFAFAGVLTHFFSTGIFS